MASISTHEFTKALQSCEFSGDQVDQHVSILKKYLSESGITSRQELAMFLANVFHESGGLKHVREIQPHPTNYVNNGINYYGRGFLQLTHHYNYRDASRALYGDEKVLLANPELVADQLEVAWRTALWFWKDRVHSKYLKRLEQGDFDASILGINSMELSSTATAQQQEQVRRRRQYYASIRDVLRGGGSGGASAARVEGGGGSNIQHHVVQPGECLSVIASRYGTTWQRIAQDNGITNPDFIKPGQQLTIKK